MSVLVQYSCKSDFDSTATRCPEVSESPKLRDASERINRADLTVYFTLFYTTHISLCPHLRRTASPCSPALSDKVSPTQHVWVKNIDRFFFRRSNGFQGFG